jgi:hypothetical protein
VRAQCAVGIRALLRGILLDGVIYTWICSVFTQMLKVLHLSGGFGPNGFGPNTESSSE